MNAIIFDRVNTLEKAEDTLENHIQLLLDYANKNNYNVIKTMRFYRGGYTNSDEYIKNLKDMIEYNSIDILLIYDISRMGRKMDVVIDFLNYALDKKVVVFGVSANIDYTKQYEQTFKDFFDKYKNNSFILKNAHTS